MGFLGYTNLFLPKLIIHNSILNLISFILHFIGLDHIIDIELPSNTTQHDTLTHSRSSSAILLRELLPIIKFSDLVNPLENMCVVCLYEFKDCDDIRGLSNCRHVFHRCCIDRWMDHDRTTCPVCRTPFIHEDLQDSFNERLWAASGIADYYGDSSLFGIS